MEIDITTREYRIQVHDQPASIDARAWNNLLAAQAEPTPFMRHEYLLALHESGSAVPSTGWQARFITLERDQCLHAAAACYLKAHSYGEYVFDWAWADAYQRHGLRYYPKLLGAVPFTPVPGARLLCSDGQARTALVAMLKQQVLDLKLSSAHVLFLDDGEVDAFRDQGWMIRHGVQFHWTRDLTAPCRDFGELLARLQRDKRKKIQQERRKVAEAGVSFTTHAGAEISATLWDFFYRCYELTYLAHRSTPYLSREFFAAMARDMPDNWLLFVAWQGDEAVGCSLIAIDPAKGLAWGRYWGATRYIPCLHFEACYYQPLSWCITNGFQRFEGGAQGEHKMARGLLPVQTSSAHWLRDSRFAEAVGDFLAQEGQGMHAYIDELRDRNPFKASPGAETTGP